MKLLTLSLFSSCTLLLLPSLSAQSATAATIALVVKTSDPDVAERVADTFAFEDEMPTVGEGQCYVLSLNGDGKLSVASEKGAPTFMQLRARPALLAEIFAEKIEATQQKVAAIAGMAAGQIGASPQELSALIDDVFAFPKQLDSLNVEVQGSDRQGYDGKIDVVPTASGWFGKFVTDLKPNKLGAPVVTDADALLSFSANLENAALVKAMRPFVGFLVGAAATDKEEKAKYTAMMLDLLAQLDGTMGMAMGADGKSQKMLVGVVDGKKLTGLIESGDFKAWRQANAEANPMADVEIKDAALTHREVSCNKQVTEVSGPSGPNTTTQFTGVADAYLLGAGNEADTKALIDAVLDQKVARKALPDNALMTISAKVAEMVRMLSGGMSEGEDAPTQLDVTLAKQGDAALSFVFKVGL